MARQSIKSIANAAKAADAKLRRSIQAPDGSGLSAVTADSFVNFQHKLGIGADNPLTGASYGFNPISRNRTLLEWIHRGSWLGGVAVDLVADDMTRAGIEYVSELPPDDTGRLDRAATSLGTWNSVNECIRWGRLYGGCIAVAMIDGQDFRTPLRLETVLPGQYKGLMVLDRWMVDPSLEDLVTEMGPHLGLPKFYRVLTNAPALRGQAIHHSRVVLRLEGIQLPYQQRLQENLWGISVLERLYDRMVAFDSASTGVAQLVYKSYLRTLSVENLREVVAGGGPALNNMVKYVDMMRRFQGIEGITIIDKNDEYTAEHHGAFSGLSDAIMQLGQQLSGALQIPLVRLFGQSPAGLNSSGESDLRMFYDHIRQQQQKTLHGGVTLAYQLTAAGQGIKLPPNFAIDFRSLMELTDTEKTDIANKAAEAVTKAYDSGLIGRQTSLKELRQSSRVSGLFTNITEEMINSADDEVQPPMPEGMEGLMPPEPGQEGGPDDARPNGEAAPVATRTRRRIQVQQPAKGGGEADRDTD